MSQSQRQSAIPIAHQRALIPSTRLDFPTQRLYAVCFFGILQSIKAWAVMEYYLAPYPELYHGILFKWCLYDCLYIVALYILRIPWLQFSTMKSIFLSFILIFINTLLFGGLTTLFTVGFLQFIFGDSLGKQLSVSRAKLVDIKDVIYDPSHILGRHTVHILPYGTAKLNPNNEYYCLPSNEIGRTDIYIPIVLNNTIPKKVSVSRYDYNSHVSKIQHFSSDKLQRGTEVGQGKQGLEIYYIRVNEPGVYKLDNIISKDGLDIRLYNRQAFVFTCPTAKFLSSQSTDYCKGDKDSIQLQVTGVPPLKVEYTRRIGDTVTDLKLDHIQPTELTFESPLTSLSSGLVDANPSFFVSTNDKNENYDWAAGRQLSIELNVTFGTAKNYDYQLKRVIDGAGNVVDLGNTPSQVFNIHEHPAVHFECNARYPMKLLIGQQSVELPLSFRGSAPYSITYEKLPDNNNTIGDGSENDNSKKDIKQVKFKPEDPLKIKVNSPGEYKLLSIHDQFCKGNVLYPSTCLVTQPPYPSVKLDTTPIPSECASGSEVGMKFVAIFQGAPPYRLKYSVIKHNGRRKEPVDQLEISTDQSRHIFSYLPKSSGDYTYEFTSLTDGNYQIDPKIDVLEQTVHPQPDVRFIENVLKRRTCIGEQMSFNVELRGTAPYTLYWAYDKQSYSSEITSNNYEISIPPFETAGRHVISLVKIEDKNGCVKELDSRDIVIDVRRERPSAFFYYENKMEPTIYIADDETTKLPLRFTGEGPWDITYQHIDDNGKLAKPVRKQFYDANTELQVSKTGTYELLDVNDVICKGDVYNVDYNVKWMERPTLSIPEEQVNQVSDNVFERAAVCQGVDDAIDIKFSGNGPFTSVYDTFLQQSGSSSSILSSFGRRDNGIKLDSHEVTSGLTTARISLTTSSHGKYKYIFNQLADQRYTKLFKPSPVIQLQQTVHELPKVKFSSKSSPSSVRMMCVGDNIVSNEDPIWLEATGQAPFTVYIRIHHQDTPVKNSKDVLIMENIETNQFKLDLPGVLDTSGKYTIELLRIQDANHCASDVSELPDTKMTIDALGIATITPLDSCSEMCVGDQLEYSLSGEGPFTIVYEFNGQREKVKSTTTKFSMIADEPGNLTMVSVGNQRNKCQSFPKDINAMIHPIPSSFVSGGKDIIENIREGEMVQAIVDLVGTPPFDFEWKRSELIWDHAKKHHYKGRVLESHVVHGVEDYRYAINTSTEGVIEVVSIKDKYCQYPRA